VALSKANSESGGIAKLETLITQDLCSGDGGSLDIGDSVEMKYTSWLVTDYVIGDVSCVIIINQYHCNITYM